MTFKAILAHVPNRGTPPVAFLEELINALLPLPDELFAPNARNDVYSLMAGPLGPYTGPLHRKAVMAEVLRVLAGEESSWNWNEGVDTTNKSSMADVEGQETGIFQVSPDSMRLAPELRAFIVSKIGTDNPQIFIPAMKENHPLAVEYCARLLRVSYAWDGPLRRGEVSHAVSRDAAAEFEGFLQPT